MRDQTTIIKDNERAVIREAAKAFIDGDYGRCNATIRANLDIDGLLDLVIQQVQALRPDLKVAVYLVD